MQNKIPYIYYFINEYNIEELTNLEKNIELIFRNYEENPKIEVIESIRKFCKSTKRNFYLSNNIKLALKLGLDGVYIPSFNNKINFASKYSLPSKFKIIGSAHNINEIRIKKLQKCTQIFLSPIFKTSKAKKFLSIPKFNLITLAQNSKFIALGGINNNNFKKLKLVKIKGFAGISWIKKNGLSKLRPFSNLNLN
tara:strand:- start:1041 stop:1625 length:585 start_codon:yes stop_codon:yes gene_type:complete